MSFDEVRNVAKQVLNEKQFQAWDLYHRGAMSYQRIASALHVDRSTVQRRVWRANDKVVQAMRQNEVDGATDSSPLLPGSARDSASESSGDRARGQSRGCAA
jgi:hypothetical protein